MLIVYFTLPCAIFSLILDIDILCNSCDGLAHGGGAHCFRSHAVGDEQAVAVQWSISLPSEGRCQGKSPG